MTERRFFRCFADEREGLFPGEEQLEAVFVDAIAGAPADAPARLAGDLVVSMFATAFARWTATWSRCNATVSL